jgi:serine/threonine protein kinase
VESRRFWTRKAHRRETLTTAYARGTTGYRASELLGQKSSYNQKVDIWSMGYILYELAVPGKKAFDDDVAIFSLRWSRFKEMHFPFDNRTRKTDYHQKCSCHVTG